MTLTLTIRQSGIFKTRPGLEMLQKQFGTAYHIGYPGAYGAFSAQPAGQPRGGAAEYMLYGRNTPLGRGFHLAVAQEGAVLNLSAELPATSGDLEDLFAFTATLAGFLGRKEVEYAGGTYSPTSLSTQYPQASSANAASVKNFAIQQAGQAVSGVRFPVWLPQNLCQRIAGLPAENGVTFFQSYLADIQASDYYYMKPSFDTGADGQVFGSYVLTEGVTSIIPKQPFVPYGPPPCGGAPVERWLVALAAENIVLGVVPYQALLDFASEDGLQDFDEKHYLLRRFSQRKMQQLLADAEAPDCQTS